jgi:cold shock CspA family protein
MSRSQETYNKKEVRIKNDKRRKDKALKRAKKKSEGVKTTFEDMIAYVDEFGKISATPPDPLKKTSVDASSIEISITRNKFETPVNTVRKGIVTFFNKSAGYGFIQDSDSKESVFVQQNNLLESIQKDNVVNFEIAKGPKGPVALKVGLYREQ